MNSSSIMRELTPDTASENSTNSESISGSADAMPEAASSLYPLRFLGMGLLIAWMCCTHVNAILPGIGMNMDLRNVFDIGMRAGDIGMFILLALLAPRIGRISKQVIPNTILVILTTFGTALVGLVLIPGNASEGVITIVSAITALGGAILFCLWAEVYSQMGMTRTVVYGAFSCITAAVVSFLISTMMPPYAIAATSILPCLSFAAVMLSIRITPKEHPRSNNVRYRMPWKLIIIMAVAGFISGLAGSLLQNAEGTGSVHRVIATGLAGVVIVAVTFLRKDRGDVRFLAKVALPLSIIALALLPLTALFPDAGEFLGYAVSFLLKLAYVWFTFFVLLVLANISFRFEVPSLRMFAFARAASEAFLFLGITLRRTLQSAGVFTNEITLIAFSLGGIVLVLVCTLVWMSEKSVNSDWGASGISLTDKLHVLSPREQFLERCDKVAADYGLTTREKEIMALIAQRKSRAEIEQELFLSQNTVKTHIRHLYAKLDAHSKTDVIALFDSVQSSE